MKIKDLSEAGMWDTVKAGAADIGKSIANAPRNILTTAGKVGNAGFNEFNKTLRANGIDISRPAVQQQNAEQIKKYLTLWTLQYMTGGDYANERPYIVSAIQKIPKPTSITPSTVQEYIITAAQAREKAKEQAKYELPDIVTDPEKAKKLAAIKKARQELEQEKLKAAIASTSDYRDTTSSMAAVDPAAIASRMVRKGDIAPAIPDEKERDPNAVPLYTVTAPGGVKVTKYSDGLWIDDNDEYIGDPNDIAQLEKLATAQKYSKGSAIPKSQMPKPTWLTQKAAEREARRKARPGQLNNKRR